MTIDRIARYRRAALAQDEGGEKLVQIAPVRCDLFNMLSLRLGYAATARVERHGVAAVADIPSISRT
jgi:hypothetical protein